MTITGTNFVSEATVKWRNVCDDRRGGEQHVDHGHGARAGSGTLDVVVTNGDPKAAICPSAMPTLQADFTITASALAPASVTPGASATSTITITLANGFNAAVALTCSVAPAETRGPTCAFNIASVAAVQGLRP